VIGLVQRVSQASVLVAGETVGAIARGVLVLVGVERDDAPAQAERLLQRVLAYRVFADDQGKMNRSVQDVGGGVLLVPQFTLAADTSQGNRASFTPAAAPERGRELFDYMVSLARAQHANVATGCFGADMQVSLINDGPVTFWLQVKAKP
jgi:D-tyrosyl-tRNA(Tyr) deacylase